MRKLTKAHKSTVEQLFSDVIKGIGELNILGYHCSLNDDIHFLNDGMFVLRRPTVGEYADYVFPHGLGSVKK